MKMKNISVLLTHKNIKQETTEYMQKKIDEINKQKKKKNAIQE